MEETKCQADMIKKVIAKDAGGSQRRSSVLNVNRE